MARVVYCMEVKNELFDLFFNSSCGYRAAYFRSPDEGVNSNATFFKITELIDSSVSRNSGLGSEFINQSLLSPSAKVWLAEHYQRDRQGLCWSGVLVPWG